MKEDKLNLKKEVKIVEGKTEDAYHFANLMEISASTLFPTVFGHRFKTILENLFKEKKNLFSFEHTHIAKLGDETLGMLLAYDWRIKRKEEINTGRLIIKYMKFEFIKRFPLFLKLNSIVGYLKEGEFYISNIAVYPEYRGIGIGTTLLSFVEESMRSKNIKKLALDVETKNERAIRLYKRLGFIISRKLSTKLKGITFEFFRMEKIKAK